MSRMGNDTSKMKYIIGLGVLILAPGLVACLAPYPLTDYLSWVGVHHYHTEWPMTEADYKLARRFLAKQVASDEMIVDAKVESHSMVVFRTRVNRYVSKDIIPSSIGRLGDSYSVAITNGLCRILSAYTFTTTRD